MCYIEGYLVYSITTCKFTDFLLWLHYYHLFSFSKQVTVEYSPYLNTIYCNMNFFFDLFASSVIPQFVLMFSHILAACRVPLCSPLLQNTQHPLANTRIKTANIIVGSHRQVHQARTHIDNITATYQINNANKQRR